MLPTLAADSPLHLGRWKTVLTPALAGVGFKEFSASSGARSGRGDRCLLRLSLLGPAHGLFDTSNRLHTVWRFRAGLLLLLLLRKFPMLPPRCGATDCLCLPGRTQRQPSNA